MSLAGNRISHADPFSNISPLCAAAITRSLDEDERSRADVGAEALASSTIPPTNETKTSPVTKTALSFKVNRLDAMNVSPPQVNSHGSTSPGMPSSAFLGLLYSKAVEAKAAASSLSGGNFCRSVFVSHRCVRVCVWRRNRLSRRSRCCSRHCCCVCHPRIQPTALYQRRGEDVLVVVAFVSLRKSLGMIKCVGSLLLASC